MPSNNLLALLSPTRRVLLGALKRLGPLTIEGLAGEVSLSPAATRQQLMALTLQGLVQYHQVRQGPGRPRHVYSLTPDGESLFPQAYDEALDIILSSLGEEDPETRVRVLLRARNLSYERNLSQLRSNDPAGRLEEVRAALERGGYDPVVSWKVTDQAELSLLNCPLASLVERSRGVCDAELENIQRALPGAAVERTEYRPTGSMRCSYEMTFVSDRG